MPLCLEKESDQLLWRKSIFWAGLPEILMKRKVYSFIRKALKEKEMRSQMLHPAKLKSVLRHGTNHLQQRGGGDRWSEEAGDSSWIIPELRPEYKTHLRLWCNQVNLLGKQLAQSPVNKRPASIYGTSWGDFEARRILHKNCRYCEWLSNLQRSVTLSYLITARPELYNQVNFPTMTS